jgi:hypothetical protein
MGPLSRLIPDGLEHCFHSLGWVINMPIDSGSISFLGTNIEEHDLPHSLITSKDPNYHITIKKVSARLQHPPLSCKAQSTPNMLKNQLTLNNPNKGFSPSLGYNSQIVFMTISAMKTGGEAIVWFIAL